MELYRLISNLNLRADPSTNQTTQGDFPKGTVVQGFETNQDGTWLHVHVPNTDGGFHDGWMSLKFLEQLHSAALTWRLGVNLREFAYYGSGQGIIKGTQEALRTQQLTACQSAGIKLVRFFASRCEFDIDTCISYVGKALDTLWSTSQMQAIVCLDDSLNGSNQYMQGNESYHKYKFGHLITAYWEQRAYLEPYIRNIIKIVTAFQNHPAVLMWELGNEFGLYPSPPNPGDADAFFEFVRTASQEIRNIAPTNQLIALGLISTDAVFSQLTTDDRYTASKRLYQLPTVDAIGVHYYQDNYDDLKECIQIDWQVAHDLGKPFYIGELGAPDSAGNRPAYYADEIVRWKKADALAVMLWQLDSSPWDVGICDDRGFGKWKHPSDYQPILDAIKPLA